MDNGFELGAWVQKLYMLSTSDHASVVSMNLFVALLCGCIVIGHLLEGYRWMNESITALIIVSFNLIFFRKYLFKTYILFVFWFVEVLIRGLVF